MPVTERKKSQGKHCEARCPMLSSEGAKVTKTHRGLKAGHSEEMIAV